MVIEQIYVDRFLEKVDLHAPGGHWLWKAALRDWKREPRDGGYGAFWFHGKVVRAHIFAYWWLFGEIPAGKVLLHSCDVRHCVNVVDHIKPGTQLQNIRDMVEKGRVRNQHMILTDRLLLPALG